MCVCERERERERGGGGGGEGVRERGGTNVSAPRAVAAAVTVLSCLFPVSAV